MIIDQKKTTLAYRCPHCGAVPTSMVGAFSLSGDLFKLKCSCGNSHLTVEKTNDDTVITSENNNQFEIIDAAKLADYCAGKDVILNYRFRERITLHTNKDGVTIEKKTSLNYYEYRGEWKHYEVSAENQIIDVITCDEPIIRKIDVK